MINFKHLSYAFLPTEMRDNTWDCSTVTDVVVLESTVLPTDFIIELKKETRDTHHF